MPTQFANTLNNHPIYADRAENDAAGNNITTTYQEKLTAGTGITIDSSNVISATGGGGGGTYTAGTGIDISAQDAISVKIDGSTITTNGSGQLVANSGGGTSYTAGTGIDISAQDAISVKIDGSTITTNGSGQLVANGGGGTSYTAGTGIDITSNTIGVKIDGSTITTNSSGQLVANGGGGGSGLTVGSTLINGNLYQDQHFFTIDGLSVDYKYDTTGGSLKTYISVSSSTVSTAYIDKKWLRFTNATAGGDPAQWRYKCLMPNLETSPYTGVSLSSPFRLIDLNYGGQTDLSESTMYAEYPTSFDFRIYYEVNNTAKVIYLNVFIWSTGQSNGSYNVRYSYSHG